MQSRIGTFCGTTARVRPVTLRPSRSSLLLMQGSGVGVGFYAVHWDMKEECYSYHPANPTATHVSPRRAKKREQEPRRSSRTTCNAVLPGPKSSSKPTEKPLCLGVDRTADKRSGHLVSTYYVPGPRQSVLPVSDSPPPTPQGRCCCGPTSQVRRLQVRK